MDIRRYNLFRRILRNNKIGRALRDTEFPHNPNSRLRNMPHEKRTKLFRDRPFIHGRLPKFILLWAFTMTFWSSYYIRAKLGFQEYNSEVTKRALRKTVPFVQAMEDIRYNAISERNYMILKAICDVENPDLFEVYRARYNQEDFFLSYIRGSTAKNYYDGRYGTSRWWDIHSYRKPEDEKYLVGFQEQSYYG